MTTLTELITQRLSLEQELARRTEEYETAKRQLTDAIASLKEHESILGQDLDLEKINLGRSILLIEGNPYGRTDGIGNRDTIAEEAIKDVLNGCRKLRTEYFGNKRYGRWYQRNDCRYYWGPEYGSIVDRIGLQEQFREQKRDLTPEEAEAAIYYIKVFNQIQKP